MAATTRASATAGWTRSSSWSASTDVADRRVGTFSLGMGQRLGVASALLGDPRRLILDEPVNGLDPDGVRWIRTLLRGLADEGRTVFLSSHLMSEMAVTADHVIVIGRGRLLRDMPMRELIDEAASARSYASGHRGSTSSRGAAPAPAYVVRRATSRPSRSRASPPTPSASPPPQPASRCSSSHSVRPRSRRPTWRSPRTASSTGRRPPRQRTRRHDGADARDRRPRGRAPASANRSRCARVCVGVDQVPHAALDRRRARPRP